MRAFTKLRRDVKAIAPIFAALILIAIAVIAGIIVYMFTSGYLATSMSGGTAGQEKVAVEAVSVNSTSRIIVYAKVTGGGPVSVTEYILKDSQGNVLEAASVGTAVDLTPGVLSSIDITLTDVTLATGSTYTVTIVTYAGNQFVSPSFNGPTT